MGVVVDLARFDADAYESENQMTGPMFALLYAGDDVVQVIPLGKMLVEGDEAWSTDRIIGWAEAMVDAMPVDDDITSIELYHTDNVIRTVDRSDGK